MPSKEINKMLKEEIDELLIGFKPEFGNREHIHIVNLNLRINRVGLAPWKRNAAMSQLLSKLKNL